MTMLDLEDFGPNPHISDYGRASRLPKRQRGLALFSTLLVGAAVCISEPRPDRSSRGISVGQPVQPEDGVIEFRPVPRI